jgi:hypothetical protein
MTTELATKAQEAGLIVAGAPVVEGIEGIDDQDLKIGSVVLVQDTTKVFTKKGLKGGELVNHLTERKIEDSSFIPAFMTKSYFLYDNSGPQPKFVAASKNENDPIFNGKLRRTENGKKAEVIPVILVIAIMEGQPVKIAFKKASGYPAGQKLYTYARDAGRTKGLPLYGQKYRLVTSEAPAKNGNPEYWQLSVEVVGETTEDERKFAASLYQSFKAKPVDESADIPF